MGIPKFYRWISERYPLINQRVGKDTEFLPAFDNMYLDMNGIIHNCTHPNDEDVTDRISMKDMVLGMFAYVDRMVHIVQPQKVLMLAVDGCAPRAKMNQQRSRRFASAKERREGTEAAIQSGAMTEEEAKDQFDSNCITPGTEFMEEVSRHFQYFIRLKIKEDPLWRQLEVIYSGHDVPGEGEHKIMDYIRHSRMQPGYNPNLRHCICGLDADLIMLGLASHEPHFALLREQVDFTGGRGGKKAGSQSTKEVKKQVEQDKWELLHLTTLRQYLDAEFRSDLIPFGYNLERVIDDFVLLCMLVGNDFLPHLPSMSIAEGGLDDLIEKYKEVLPSLPGYLTDGTKLNFDRLEIMLATIGDREDLVFANRIKDAKKRRKGPQSSENNAPFAQQARSLVSSNSSTKDKYYAEKFGITAEHGNVHDRLRRSYIEGLQWCFAYYYQGVQSWTWFYPFHYAPMASDLVDLHQYKVTLKKGQPFLPFMQLLSCLPSDSAKFLPECYRKLMTLTTSPIADFYPHDFLVDMNGKVSSWEGVNLLPFIDEKRLFDAVAVQCPNTKLSKAELDRNMFGYDIIFTLDMSNTQKLPSSFPSAGLPDIEVCYSAAKRYLLPAMTKFIPDLLPGTIADGNFPGDPRLFASVTLRSDIPGSLRGCGLNCFGRESRGETFVLNVRSPASLKIMGEHTETMAEAIVPSLAEFQRKLNRRMTVFVNYPNLREAEVVAVADEDFIFVLQEEKKKVFRFVKNVQTEYDSEVFMKDATSAENKSLSGCGWVGTGGLDIGSVDVMVKVRPLQGLVLDSHDGSTKQVFSDVETWVPYQLVCYQNDAPDKRLQSSKGKALKQRFPLQSRVMCLESSGYGLVGTVTGHVNDTAVVAEFSNEEPQIPPFGHTIATSIVDHFVPSHTASKQLGMDAGALGKITGTLLVRPGRYDIGLNLKVGKGYAIPGYARSRSNEATKPPWSGGETLVVVSGLDPVQKAEDETPAGHGGWEFSKKALDLIHAYKKKFPQVFAAMAKNPSTYEYEMTEIFGQAGAQDMMDKVCKWLEQIDTFKLPLVPVSSKTMSRDAIAAVQQASDDVMKSWQQSKRPNKTIAVKLAPTVLFLYDSNAESSWYKSPSSAVPPKLGDRVCNMSSPVVPFGLGGTVVATHASTGCVEVVFDTDFVGGTSLYGSCGNRRGKLLPWTQLLNLSKKVAVTKQQARPQPVPKKNEPIRPTSNRVKKSVPIPYPAVQSLFASAATSTNNWNVPSPVLAPTDAMKQPEFNKLNQSEAASHTDAGLTHEFHKLSPQDDDDDLAQYWLSLEQNRKSAKKKKSPKPVVQKPVVQKVLVQEPKSPPPVPVIHGVQAKSAEDDPMLEDLFRRAVNATRKDQIPSKSFN